MSFPLPLMLVSALAIIALLWQARGATGTKRQLCRFGATLMIIISMIAAAFNLASDPGAAESVAREDLYQTAALHVFATSCLKGARKASLRVAVLEAADGPPAYLPKLEKLFGPQVQIKAHLKFKTAASPEELRDAFINSGCDLVIVTTTLPENAEDLKELFEAEESSKMPAVAISLTAFDQPMLASYFVSGQIICGVRTRPDYVYSDSKPSSEKEAFAQRYLLVEGQR